MKLTDTIADLLLDLSEIESPQNIQLLISDTDELCDNLLTLYRTTDNPNSHSMIIQIMMEAGAPWFGKLMRVAESNDTDYVAINSQSYCDNGIMSEEDFLDMVPINGLFH